MASYYYKSSISLLLSLILCSLVSLAQSNNNGGVTIDLIHRDSPLSPYHDPSQTRFERLRNAFDRSFARKSFLLLGSSNSVGLDKALDAPITGNGNSYLIEYKIGTPPVRQFSAVDTGKDLTWMQCKPCTKCYKQDFPYFDPSATKTYRPVACNTIQCKSMSFAGCDNSSMCGYKVTFIDDSFSQGKIATDTLTLGSTPFSNFVFGCGHNNVGDFDTEESGIFGLGKGAISFVNQQSRSVNGKFSYCLTPLESKVPSKISFGRNAVVKGFNVKSTPMVSKQPDKYYFVTIKGFSVGSKRIEYKPKSPGNIIIESGTTLSFVPTEVYRGIALTLKSAINSTRVYESSSTLCYKLPIRPPPITAHFQGADLKLAEENIFLEVAEGVGCLSFSPSDDVSTFGNLHQIGYLIGYDIPKKKVSFKKTDCTKRH